MYGEVFFGCHWRIEPDKEDEATEALREALNDDTGMELDDLLDSLVTHYKAQLHYKDGTRTVYFGVPITTLNESDNEFDERSIVRVMDLNRGTLRKDVKDEMTKIMEGTPYSLRDRFTHPRFAVAWGS